MPLAALLLAQPDAAGDLGHDGRVARPAGLEDLRDARQTAGDVLRAADLARRLGQQRAGRRPSGPRALRGGPSPGCSSTSRLWPRSSSMTICGCRSPLCSMMTQRSAPAPRRVPCGASRPRRCPRSGPGRRARRGSGCMCGSHLHSICAGLHLLAVLDQQHRRRWGPRTSPATRSFGADDVHLAVARSGRSRSPWSLMTALMRSSLTVPAFLALISLSPTSRLTTPPMWKVRIVSCVPGSPIDWAAMMPTAMPSSTSVAGGQVHAVAQPADAQRRLAGHRAADQDLVDAQRLDLAGLLPGDHLVLVDDRPRRSTGR